MAAKRKVTPPPADLGAPAQARWKAVYPILAKRGDVDLEQLRTYCQVWARWRESEDAIGKAGQLTKTPTGRVVPSPLIAVEEKAASRVRELEARLGIGTKAEPERRERTSLRGFAKRVGVTENAVRKAIASGRLSQSIGREKNRPFVRDAELAEAEWSANSQPQPDKTKVISHDTLVEAQRSATLERARKLKLDNDLKDGRLIEVATVKREWFELARTIRKAIQNIPARLSAELAAEPDAGRVYSKLDAALRDALNVLADEVAAVAQ